MSKFDLMITVTIMVFATIIGFSVCIGSCRRAMNADEQAMNAAHYERVYLAGGVR